MERYNGAREQRTVVRAANVGPEGRVRLRNSLGIGKGQERLEAMRGGRKKERQKGHQKSRGDEVWEGAGRASRDCQGRVGERGKGRAGHSVGQEIRTNGSVPAPPHLGHQDIAGATAAFGRPHAPPHRSVCPSACLSRAYLNR
ncbi:hypothetical protein E2C01_084489 [Portunus trituberculatus]|uniref:Uncharacterized protein n=1 Tax=Portunus trituberculatus TaxID=210409 RepID=A0A5B7J7N7_PORTR|nr:hypothetical protein [Portunus trituberculatus]